MTCESILTEATNFYLTSHDHNGISVASLVKRYGEAHVKRCLSRLIHEGLTSVVFGDYHPNPHIKALPSEPEAEQRRKLDTELFSGACVYPSSERLKHVVDPSRFTDRPFRLCLELGEPQLTHKSFDLSVLETYRNDPRYFYRYDDISGFISVKEEYYRSAKMNEADQILLESFGFSFDSDKNIYVAVFLRYLSSLSPEHQLVWAAKQVGVETHLHPDYFRTAILGRWPERLSLFQAVLLEMKTVNEICAAIGRSPLFRDDFSEGRRPCGFGYLLRPTSREFGEFVHLLDKMLSDNINREFFANDVPLDYEEKRKDGRVSVRTKGTVRILEDWLRARFTTDDWAEIDGMLKILREVRSMRQQPAHSIRGNEFDKHYLQQQIQLMKRVYRAVRTLRLVLALHPKAADVKVRNELEEPLIWAI